MYCSVTEAAALWRPVLDAMTEAIADVGSPLPAPDLRLQVLDMLSDGIWITEIDGEVLYRNAAGAAMEKLYWSRAGRVGTLEDVVFNEDILNQLREQGRGSAECHLEADEFTESDVSSVFMDMQALRDSAGEIMALFFHARDVSREWERERILQNSNIEIEHAYLRLKQTQAQLLQAEKMASIGQLAAGVAHEINNPIGYVHSNLGTLQIYVRGLMRLVDAYDHLANELSRDNVEAVAAIHTVAEEIDYAFMREDLPQLLMESREGIERVKQIVLDLRDFSHGGQGEPDEWTIADLHRGLETTLNIVWNDLKYKAEVIKDFGALPLISCLPSQLNQVFLNLLVNAGQAIEARGVITITTSCTDDEVCVAISDSGAGIAPDHLKRIFEPFFTTKSVGQGTGLGLALSYGIVEQHHGRIVVESELGKGSCFRVYLPIHQHTTDSIVTV